MREFAIFEIVHDDACMPCGDRYMYIQYMYMYVRVISRAGDRGELFVPLLI